MITIDESQIEHAKKVLASVPDGVEKAAASALNRAAEHARTQAKRKVRETYTVKMNRLDERMDVKRANQKNLFASVQSKGRPVVLSYFNVRPGQPLNKRTTRLVYAQVRRDGGGTIRKVFVARTKSGHIGVFRRTDGNKRLPIKQLYAPSLPQMLGTKSVSDFALDAAMQVLPVRFDHEISRLLPK